MRSVHLILLLVLILLFAPTWAAWFGPLRVAEFKSATLILSTYRDPVARLTHVFARESQQFVGYHLAVTDAGTVASKTAFPGFGTIPAGIIRGAGDGRRLFIAFSSVRPVARDYINFTESADGGKTWTEPRYLLNSAGYIILKDVLYMQETGRVFVLFTTPKDELRAASKPAGSAVFSSDLLVSRGVRWELYQAKAVCISGPSPKQQIIHLLFVSEVIERLMYTYSSNNGLTWSEPRMVAAEEAAVGVVSAYTNERVGPRIYFGFIAQGLVKLIYTEDGGKTFSAPATATSSELDGFGGAALCGTSRKPTMATLFPLSSETVEYALWNLSKMRPQYRNGPFVLTQVTSAGVECVSDGEELTVTAFVVAGGSSGKTDRRYHLYFARERVQA